MVYGCVNQSSKGHQQWVGEGQKKLRKKVFQEGGLIAPLVETSGTDTAHCLSTGVFG